MNWFEPWIFVRLIAGAAVCILFARAARTGVRVLRNFHAARSSEGQLALEKQFELGGSLVRVACAVHVVAVLVGILGADQMSRGVRGAMCAYGVFAANRWGFGSLAASLTLGVVAVSFAQFLAFDKNVRSFDLARPIAWWMVLLGPLAILEFACVMQFYAALDLSASASCCSAQLDGAVAKIQGWAFVVPREAVANIAVGGALGSCVSAAMARRSTSARRVAVAAISSLVTLPFALATTAVYVAPHIFETPLHTCPFCLFRADVFGIGYLLYGALFMIAVWMASVAVALGVVRSRPAAVQAPFAAFARRALGRTIAAWALFVAVGGAPILRYALLTDGSSLFDSGNP